MSHLIRVGVLRGGPSNEHDISLLTGREVIKILRDNFYERFEPADVYIDHDGNWHLEGIPLAKEDAVNRLDVIFNALHGAYGEDGRVQHFLEHRRIPFTGSGSIGSAVGMNKAMTKKVFKDNAIKSPYWKEIASSEIRHHVDAVVKQLFTSFILPAIVKPTSSGSSVGVSLVRKYPDLAQALSNAASHSDSVLLEEYIPGIEATCGVIEGFRGHDLYALPPIEIRPATQFFSYEDKYHGICDEIVPATFSQKIKAALEELSRKIHLALGLRHYSRSDFIIHPRRGIYALESNTLPGLTAESLMPKALRAVGSDTPEMVRHIIELALRHDNVNYRT